MANLPQIVYRVIGLGYFVPDDYFLMYLGAFSTPEVVEDTSLLHLSFVIVLTSSTYFVRRVYLLWSTYFGSRSLSLSGLLYLCSPVTLRFKP